MSNPTTPFNWQMPTPTDLVTDLPADFEVFGQAVATSMADLLGGTTGQILSKNSNTDMDFVWITNDQGDITAVNTTAPLQGGGTSGALTLSVDAGTTSAAGVVQLTNSVSSTSTTTAAVPANVKTAYDLAAAAIPLSTVTTSGDIIYATGSGAVTRRAIGTTGQVLTVSGGVPTWAAASSGAMTQIADTTLGSAAADITFSSIPNTYNHLKLVISGASSSGAWNGAGFNIQINADSGTNYSFSTVSKYAGPGATMTLEGQNSQTQIELGNIWCGQAQANSLSSIDMTFFNYKGTTLQKGMVFSGGSWTDAPAFGSGWGRWKSTSAITSIKLYSGAGNFMTGTRATLYGWT